MKRRFSVFLLFAAHSFFGQQSPAGGATKSPAIRLQRTPTPRTLPADGVPTPDKYPFDRLINTLNDEQQVPAGTGAQPTVGPAGKAPSDVPRDFKPDKDVPLPASATDALAVGRSWMAERQAPAPGKDGRVLYT